ncbi:hypothetical protein R5R35_011278 [Gryllus longicercus]|uniref:Mitochondrial import inner membrane translocase subunit Tim29 n=1 Tax=Gryllus longicercus TaxID=2509291 RepID=A0AAN9VDP2_9ORTH
MFRSLNLPLSRLQTTVKTNVLNLTNVFQRISEPIVKKCEGTVIERAGIFLKNVAIDYKEVFSETYDRAKKFPIKMSLYAGVMGIGAYCAAVNPDETSFRDQLLLNQQKIMMLADPIRNPLPLGKMKQIEIYYNQGRMRIFSFGIVSFMWVHDHDDRTALFEAKCEYLSPTLMSYPSRVVDIGFWGKWWLLSRYMEDYDINPEEFKN